MCLLWGTNCVSISQKTTPFMLSPYSQLTSKPNKKLVRTRFCLILVPFLAYSSTLKMEEEWTSHMQYHLSCTCFIIYSKNTGYRCSRDTWMQSRQGRALHSPPPIKKKLNVTAIMYRRQVVSSHTENARVVVMNMYQAEECKSCHHKTRNNCWANCSCTSGRCYMNFNKCTYENNRVLV
jgi:hypothetical protein